MASRVVFAALLLSLCAGSAYAQSRLFGGATSIVQYVGDSKFYPRFRSTNKLAATDFYTYASVGSGAGVDNYKSGAYVIGASDDPMSIGDYNSISGGTLTVPLALSTYAFFTKKKDNIKITGAQAAGIYLGTITSWSQIDSSLSGTIVPVARLDDSGTTAVFGTYFADVSSAWPNNRISADSWSKFSFASSSIVYKQGSGAVGNEAAGNANAIAYIQTGIGLSRGLFPLDLQNKAGQFIDVRRADPQQSIQRAPPPNNTPWNAVDLINKAGSGTYPLASFIFMFTRLKPARAHVSITNKFLIFTQQSTVQDLARTYQFYRLPASINKAAIAAIKKYIK